MSEESVAFETQHGSSNFEQNSAIAWRKSYVRIDSRVHRNPIFELYSGVPTNMRLAIVGYLLKTNNTPEHFLGRANDIGFVHH